MRRKGTNTMHMLTRRTPFFASTDFADLFGTLAGTVGQAARTAATPSMPIDVHHTERAIVVEAEVPGFAKDDISVEFHEGVLTIAATRAAQPVNAEKPAEQAENGCCGTTSSCCGTASASATARRTVLRERSTPSSVRRSLAMPDRVSGEGITAEICDGLLTVTLPFAAKPAPKRISVN
jgi:HSP20 family molecular chaperone IbpA